MKAYRTLQHKDPVLICQGTEKECRAAIVKDYTDRGEKSYYWNCSVTDNKLNIDYGSWSVFYHIQKENNESFS